MEQLVVEQEPMVQQIEARGQEVVDNTGKANEELGVAVKSARSARRKKWWCLLIARKCFYVPVYMHGFV